MYPKLIINQTPKKPHTKSHLCACKVFALSAFSNRILGRFVYTWKHVGNECVYEISRLWMIYSVTLMTILGISAKYALFYLQFNINNFLESLDSLINLLNVVYVCLTALHLINMKAWIRFIRGLSRLNRGHFFCQLSKKRAYQFQRNFLATVSALFLLQNIVHILLSHTSSLHILFFRNLIALPVLSYVLWFSCIRYCTSMFICFENVVVHCLGYKPVHPARDIEFTHNVYEFAGFATGRKVCDEKHYMPEHLKKLSRAQVIEYLRIRHEEMWQTVLLLEEIMSPQLLAYIIVEIAANIVSWYSIVVYLVYQFDTPTAKSTFILNCIYVVWHGFGIYWFFNNVQTLKNVMQGLKSILMACVLTNQTEEEHQQLRIFFHKIANQRPITVNDFFAIDLGIIGPFVGNILTYVLVALQFEIPPQEQN